VAASVNAYVLVHYQDRATAPSIWKLEDPEMLQKERDEKKAVADAAAKLKLERKRDNKVSTASANPSISSVLALVSCLKMLSGKALSRPSWHPSCMSIAYMFLQHRLQSNVIQGNRDVRSVLNVMKS
jgi:hypothetical protein